MMIKEDVVVGNMLMMNLVNVLSLIFFASLCFQLFCRSFIKLLALSNTKAKISDQCTMSQGTGTGTGWGKREKIKYRVKSLKRWCLTFILCSVCLVFNAC